jgi:hypothetical protein
VRTGNISAIASHSQSIFCGEASVCRDGIAMPASIKPRGSWNSLERAGNSAIENVQKNPIHWQKNFEFVGEFEASSEMRSL